MRLFRPCTGTGSVEAARRFGASSLATASRSKKSLRAAEQQRPDVARARRRWLREQRLLDTTSLVFIDETAVSTNMVRPNGRGPRGQRVLGQVPLGHWETMTFVAGLRHNGIVAPMLIKGAMNGEIFLAYLEQCLAPTLRRGDIVVIDNLCSQGRWCGGAHRGDRCKPALAAAVFPGLQSHRDRVSCAEGIPAQSCGSNHRRSVETHRLVHSDPWQTSVHGILQACRICATLTGIRFRRVRWTRRCNCNRKRSVAIAWPCA